MKINHALISVSEKKNITSFAEGLIGLGINIYSTGGTYKLLSKNSSSSSGLSPSIKPLSDLAPFPEILDGRVKTLQPQIHAGILFDRKKKEHKETIKKKNIIPLDLVVVNLYPFAESLAKKSSHSAMIENIDIGGVTLLRAAAKNYQYVSVLCDFADYEECLKQIKKNKTTSLSFRKYLAEKAFEHTSTYDTSISNYFQSLNKTKGTQSKENEFNSPLGNLPLGNLPLEKKLRYGENPHQQASFLYSESKELNVNNLKILSGKEMSYNNFLDVEAALRTLEDFKHEINKKLASKLSLKPASNLALVIKHQNPCGIGLSPNALTSLKLAWQGDEVSAFGSIILIDGTVNHEITNFFKKKFVEIIIAKKFTKSALLTLSKKKNLRLLEMGNLPFSKHTKEYRFITGGVLEQGKNDLLYAELTNQTDSKEKINSSQQKAIKFAILSIKKVKSNAILTALQLKKDHFMVTGIGCGQPNRLDAMKIALEKTKENLIKLFPNQYEKKMSEVVLVSDAFFPFKDGVEIAHHYGVKNVVEPGGSIRDDEVIDFCKQKGINLYFTGTRHFFH